jgi:hypothetical protein
MAKVTQRNPVSKTTHTHIHTHTPNKQTNKQKTRGWCSTLASDFSTQEAEAGKTGPGPQQNKTQHKSKLK